MPSRPSVGTSLPTPPTTPNVRARKSPHCRTCGSPMLGHKKATCTVTRESTSHNEPTEDELSKSFVHLEIEVKDKEIIRQRRRSSLRKRVSLDSLSDSCREIVNGLLTPKKEEGPPSILSDDYNNSPEAPLLAPEFAKDAPSTPKPLSHTLKERPIMPGTLIKPELDDDTLVIDLKPAAKAPIDIPKVPQGKRKSVRVSLPGSSKSSLRLQRAQTLDTSEAGAILRAMFFKTTIQQAALFKLTSKDCSNMEIASSNLGLQCHYYQRSNPEDKSPEADINWLIVGKNTQAIDDMLQTMENEVEESSAKPGTAVTAFFLTQLTAAGIAGAAAMWAGLAFT